MFNLLEQGETMEKELNGKRVRLEKGDVTDLAVDAFVYYATENLLLGSGYGTAIASRGGPVVQTECNALAPIGTGEAVITTAGEMKAGRIIHAVGPRFHEEDEEGKLRATMGSVLRVAEENGIETLALPAMGSGFYGVPVDLCADVMVDCIKSHLTNGGTALKEVIICVPDTRELGPFNKKLEAI